jgi:acetyl-CoA carboxylase carboxyltransferase component
MGDIIRQETEKLARLRQEINQMGGQDAVNKQHGRGKLTARERLDLLIETGTFVETGMLGSEFGVDVLVPADGVITGYGKLDDGVRVRDVAVAAYDFTVRGGSMGIVNETKVARIREIALRERIPMIWLNDSGGARVSGGGFSGERVA